MEEIYIHIILRTEAEDGWRTRVKTSSRQKGAQGLGGFCASVQGCPLVHHEAASISVRTRMKVEVDTLVIEGDATTVSTKVQYSGVVTGDGRSCTATVRYTVLQRRTTRLWWMNGETRPIVPGYTRIDADVNSPLK